MRTYKGKVYWQAMQRLFLKSTASFQGLEGVALLQFVSNFIKYIKSCLLFDQRLRILLVILRPCKACRSLEDT
jgi:hypothetical protein